MDENVLDRIIYKVEVITRFVDLNNWAHSGEHTGSQGSPHSNLPTCLFRGKLVSVFKAKTFGLGRTTERGTHFNYSLKQRVLKVSEQLCYN